MPLFVVSRTYQETSMVEDPEFGMVHFLAMSWNEPRYDWVRSFGRSSFGFCVYRGPDALELGIQQRLCRLDYDEVREVEEVPGASSGPGIDRAPDGWSLFLAERTFPQGSSSADVLHANAPHAEGVACALWLRSYWDPERATSRCIFAAETSEAARGAVSLSPHRVDRFVKVGTNHPSTWGYLYDRMGLPRHWETPGPA
ncbi:MAG: hypothetical protein IPF51_09200 [Dehalococcoidia bacterium]|uniref:hypothetical protein n=1 Tax=Candidatus Amarobacter glycogenicus TaxID=3140699 RepID=UPI003137187C|nr:hypothetical protein [Dehalococcoidia bacterium]